LTVCGLFEPSGDFVFRVFRKGKVVFYSVKGRKSTGKDERMPDRIMVSRGGNKIYDIVMERSFGKLKEELISLGLEGKKICIVTDDRVSGFYLTPVYEIVSEIASKAAMFVFTAGEKSKTLETVRELYEALIRQEFDRKDVLIALGGGVTGDLCGFAAATYLRGISFIQIPTSLLAQVDSSIGGKTGVNFSGYKNMVGAFHMPLLVYINLTTLQSLPDREFSSGMGEVIKHGLIWDPVYYEMLCQNRKEILNRNPDFLEKVVSGSARIKQQVVENDPEEKGLRRILNFGHTLGHAVEKESGFLFSHGESVALGMICALSISADRGMVPDIELQKLIDLLSFFSLPVKCGKIDPGHILEDTLHDKKMESGKIRFILLGKIGEAYVDDTVTENEMRKSLEKIYE